MDFSYLNKYTNEELEDLIDTLNMNICRRMFSNNNAYYNKLNIERNEAIKILNSRKSNK